jgi:hypothetical protein
MFRAQSGLIRVLCGTPVALLLLVLVSSAGCGKPLRSEGVQAAVDQALDFTKKGGAVRVVGVQEFPQRNEARADLVFASFQYNAGSMKLPKPKNEVTPLQPSPEYRYTQEYSGQGVAILKHYSDGRWMLTRIDFNDIFISPDVPIQ